MEFTADELWSRVLDATRDRLQEQTYRTWLASTSAVGVTDTEVLVEVPSQFHVEWIGDRYGPLLKDVIQQILGRPMALTFRCADPATVSPIPTVEVTPQALGSVSPATAPHHVGPPPTLNHRYVFERFVVGNNNELATAACHAVADKPALTYNPLFLYGGVGLGKTHLMHAIGNAVLQADPAARVAYVPSEQFTNDMVTAIQQGTTADFRRRYRQMDLLLVDDIHFLKGKERTQEEFFHTFNSLYGSHKQIVLTSDKFPKEIPNLEERLRSRFEWGLIADIQPPDLETKIAILRKKGERDNSVVPDDVCLFIASNCHSNIRELGGAFNKVVAYAAMSGREITLDLARETLRDFLPSESPAATIDSIMKLVSNYYNMPVSDLKAKNNSQQIAFPRQIAMYLCKKLTDCSLPEIGRRFGGKHHSTVIHAIRKIEKKRAQERDFDKLQDNFMQSLK